MRNCFFSFYCSHRIVLNSRYNILNVYKSIYLIELNGTQNSVMQHVCN